MQCVRRTSAVHPIEFSRSTYPIVVEEAQRPATTSDDSRLVLVQQIWVYFEIHKRERADGDAAAADSFCKVGRQVVKANEVAGLTGFNEEAGR